MSDAGIGLGMLDSAEEEFMEAVRKQSIGVLRPSKNLVSPTERRLDGVESSLRPVLTKNNYVYRSGAPRDPVFYNQTTPRGAATGKAEKEMMMRIMMAQIPAPTVKAYARPPYLAPSTGRQMNTARTTLTPSVMALRPQPHINKQQHQQQQQQQPKAVAASVTMATPTAKSAHHSVPVPLSSPLQDIADRWAREIDAARERRKQLKWQFRRDFGIGY